MPNNLGHCPRCKQDIPDYPSLSRFDNATEICSQCGILEALFNFEYPYRPLTPPNQPVIAE